MSGERILVIDDGKENRDFIVQYVLEPNGFEALVARDGMEGLELARQYRPDLVLLDLQMPRMNGMEFLDAINAEQLEIPVILMTFHGSEEIAVEVYRKGVKDYIKKPYTVEEMFSAIEHSLSDVRLRHEKDQLTERLIAANASLNQRVRELNVLYGIGKSITSQIELEPLMMRVSEAAAKLTSCEECSVYLREGKALKLRAIWRESDHRAYTMNEIREEALAIKAVQSGRPLVLSEGEIEAMRRSNPSAPTAGMAAPLIIADKPVGVLVVKNLSPGARLFTKHDVGLLSALSDYAAIAYENATNHERVGYSSGQHGALRRALVTDVYSQVSDDQLAEINGIREQVVMLMVQIEGYLGFSRKAPPEQIVPLINDYLSVVGEHILKHQGALNMMSGDTVIGMFNAPFRQEHPVYRACYAALELQSTLSELNEKRGGGLMVRIGLHVGEAVVGYFGIERAMIYTAIGEPLRIAQELLTKAKPAQILVTDRVAQMLGDVAQLETAGTLPTTAGQDTIAIFELRGFSS